MFWKDYLYFTRSERNGIKVLLGLIIVVAFAPAVIRLVMPVKELDAEWVAFHLQEFEDSSVETDRRQQASGRPPAEDTDDGMVASARRTTARPEPERTWQVERQDVNLSPHLFNPNNLPSEEWEAMGLPAHVVRTIKNYEAAGGSFRFREDVQRIYLMEEEWYAQLEPYIDLPSRHETIPQKETNLLDETIPREETSATERLLVDINRADTMELVRLRGIGQVFSRRIVEYRERLGGFVHPDQLLEVFGMDSARLEQFLPDIVIDTAAIRRISIQEADFIALVRHPYIDRNLANAIIAFRDQHQPLDSLGQLRQSFLITDEVYDRISPYMKR